MNLFEFGKALSALPDTHKGLDLNATIAVGTRLCVVHPDHEPILWCEKCQAWETMELATNPPAASEFYEGRLLYVDGKMTRH